MTEHEMLHDICEKIGYKAPFDFDEGFYVKKFSLRYQCAVDVREIIFTPEFWNKYWEYYRLNKFSSESIYQTMQSELINNLDNPVQYLKDLIS